MNGAGPRGGQTTQEHEEEAHGGGPEGRAHAPTEDDQSGLADFRADQTREPSHDRQDLGSQFCQPNLPTTRRTVVSSGLKSTRSGNPQETPQTRRADATARIGHQEGQLPRSQPSRLAVGVNHGASPEPPLYVWPATEGATV